MKRALLYFYLATHLPMWPLWRMGIIPEATARGLWARHLGWTVRGWTREEAAVAFAWIAERYVQPLVRPDVKARLREHQAAAHRVILVSGTLAPLLAEIGRQLGVEETVGTPLVLQSGRYTGGCELPICQGTGKVLRLEAHLHGRRRFPWSQSYAYADSYTDIPLLERVGHPVAVYADEQLAAHARGQGWEIMGINGCR